MKKLTLLTFSFVSFSAVLFASDKADISTSGQNHYSVALQAYKEKNWQQVVDHFSNILKHHGTTPFAHDAEYYLGVAYFHLGDFEMANEYFSDYLDKTTKLKFFEDALRWKFNIAEQYRAGVRFPLIRWKYIPRILPSNEEAIEIYDEVITALSNQDLVARALYGKGKVLARIKEFSESIDIFHQLIRRFPKHSLTPEAYLAISKNYFDQVKEECADPDLLQLAEINLQKFQGDFPGSSLVAEAEKHYQDMEELYADDLFRIGDFYERTKKPNAAKIYYRKILQKYPESPTALRVEKRLEKIEVKERKVAARAAKNS